MGAAPFFARLEEGDPRPPAGVDVDPTAAWFCWDAPCCPPNSDPSSSLSASPPAAGLPESWILVAAHQCAQNLVDHIPEPAG